MRSVLKVYNIGVSDIKDKVKVSGYGIHSGELLYIPDTDVHWGDPVNTASKLGQDTATGG